MRGSESEHGRPPTRAAARVEVGNQFEHRVHDGFEKELKIEPIGLDGWHSEGGRSFCQGQKIGRTPLMIAAERGEIECVRLLRPLSEVNAKSRGPEHEAAHSSGTALIRAAAGGHLDCLLEILPYSEVLAEDGLSQSALTYSARQGDQACVEALVMAIRERRASTPSRAQKIEKHV